MNILKQLIEEIEKKNSWGKNELKELILKLLVDSVHDSKITMQEEI